MVRLIVALPNPGCTGAPRGLFYADTTEGNEQAAEFARVENRPGWGVFDAIGSFRDDADAQTFSAVLKANGWGR